MAKQTNSGNKKPAQKLVPEKKPLIDERYKNPIVTGIIILVMIVFFIVNNTRKEPGSGPYPPYYTNQDANK